MTPEMMFGVVTGFLAVGAGLSVFRCSEGWWLRRVVTSVVAGVAVVTFFRLLLVIGHWFSDPAGNPWR